MTSTSLNTHVRDNLSGVLPIGTLILRVAAYSDQEVAVESRWLQCNGYAVSRTTYADLFAYFNSMSPALPFGVGDGVTTFNLPDLRGRLPAGQGTHSEVDVLGESEGAALANRAPSHHHLEYPAVSIGGYSGSGFGANPSPAQAKTTGNANLQDKPAYLVFGSYFIKYTN